MADLVGVSDLARLLGVSRQRAHQLAHRPDFPLPLGRIAGGPVWRLADVERWAAERSRRLTPPLRRQR